MFTQLYDVLYCCALFFFKQKTAYEMRISDWSSDVCSSDLCPPVRTQRKPPRWATPTAAVTGCSMPTRCVIARHRPDRRSIAQRRHPARQRLAADLGVVADIHRKTRMKHDALPPRGLPTARANRQQLGAHTVLCAARKGVGGGKEVA